MKRCAWVQALLGDAPAHLGERSCAGGRLACLRARRRAGLDPLGDALQDPGHAEQVVGEVEIPVGHHGVRDRARPVRSQ